jgi:hypothetical protein
MIRALVAFGNGRCYHGSPEQEQAQTNQTEQLSIGGSSLNKLLSGKITSFWMSCAKVMIFSISVNGHAFILEDSDETVSSPLQVLS